MTAIIRETTTAIELGVWANRNQDYVAAKEPAQRNVLASYCPEATFCDTTAWIGASCSLPVEQAGPTKEWDAEAAEAALEEQYRCFGAVKSAGQIKTSKTTYKYAKKQAALQGTLNAAFASRNAYASETVELGDQGYEDTSVEDADTTAVKLEEIYSKLNERQVQVAELLIDGKSRTEIAAILGVSSAAVTQAVDRIAARLTR